MNKKYQILTADPIICSCAQITRSTIERTIRKKKCKTVHDVNVGCGACCCCGTCRKQICEMIEYSKLSWWKKMYNLLFKKD